MKTITTHYRADYASEIKNVAMARRAVARFADAWGFDGEVLTDIRLAAGEALSNAFEHGRGARSPRFSVECDFDGNELRIEIGDSGSGFSAPKYASSIEPDHRGRGFGIFIMRRLMDDVVFARNGTVVRLVRRLTPAPALS